MKVDAVLHGWIRIGSHYAGAIYLDRKSRFPDGYHIHTSTVVSGPDPHGVIKTSNSIYLLGQSAAQLLGLPEPGKVFTNNDGQDGDPDRE
jgi:hypothetical protein